MLSCNATQSVICHTMLPYNVQYTQWADNSYMLLPVAIIVLLLLLSMLSLLIASCVVLLLLIIVTLPMTPVVIVMTSVSISLLARLPTVILKTALFVTGIIVMLLVLVLVGLSLALGLV